MPSSVKKQPKDHVFSLIKAGVNLVPLVGGAYFRIICHQPQSVQLKNLQAILKNDYSS